MRAIVLNIMWTNKFSLRHCQKNHTIYIKLMTTRHCLQHSTCVETKYVILYKFFLIHEEIEFPKWCEVLCFSCFYKLTSVHRADSSRWWTQLYVMHTLVFKYFNQLISRISSWKMMTNWCVLYTQLLKLRFRSEVHCIHVWIDLYHIIDSVNIQCTINWIPRLNVDFAEIDHSDIFVMHHHMHMCGNNLMHKYFFEETD